jgi:hypothetical protein
MKKEFHFQIQKKKKKKKNVFGSRMSRAGMRAGLRTTSKEPAAAATTTRTSKQQHQEMDTDDDNTPHTPTQSEALKCVTQNSSLFVFLNFTI